MDRQRMLNTEGKKNSDVRELNITIKYRRNQSGMSTPSGRTKEEERKRKEDRRIREERKKLEEEKKEEEKRMRQEKADQEALAKLADQKPADPTLPADDSQKEIKPAREILETDVKQGKGGYLKFG